MTTPNTMTLYLTATLQFRIDNPEALADASQLFPHEHDFDQAGLDLMSPAAMRNIANALKVVSTVSIHGALRNVTMPGAAVVNTNLTLSEDPPPAR